MHHIVSELVNNEFERCGRTLSWPNVNYQEDLRRSTKNCSHDDWAPGRDMNSKLPKCQRKKRWPLATYSLINNSVHCASYWQEGK